MTWGGPTHVGARPMNRHSPNTTETNHHMSLNNLYRRLQVEVGQTMAEYGVVLAVITIGVVLALTALSGGITNALDKVTSVVNK